MKERPHNHLSENQKKTLLSMYREEKSCPTLRTKALARHLTATTEENGCALKLKFDFSFV